MLIDSSGSKDNADDEAVKSDSFSENHHENDSNQDVSVIVATNTSVSANTNSQSRCEAAETNGETSTQVSVGRLPVVLPLRWVANVIKGCLANY